jgi:hypothetical protein
VKNDQPDRQATNLPAGLSAPAQRALAGAGIGSLEQLARMREADVKGLHGIGPNALRNLHSALEANGLSFADDKKSKEK